MEWISVKDKLPELDQVFLAIRNGYEDGDAVVLYHRKDGYVSFNTKLPDVYFSKSDFTHWMPLPEPPKNT